MQTLHMLPDQARQWTILKNSMSLEETHKEIQMRARLDGERHDIRDIDLSKCKAVAIENGLHLRSHVDDHKLRQRAFTQVCGLIKAPAHYIHRLPADLAIDCLNHGLQTYDGNPITQRMAGKDVRAVVSGRYGELDDNPVLEMLQNALKDQGLQDEVGVRALATGTVTNLRIVLHSEVKGPDGRGLRVGFDLRNSEVGSFSLLLRAVIYRMICTNGCIWQDKMDEGRWRHIGDPARLREAFAKFLPQIIDTARGIPRRTFDAHDTVISIEAFRNRLARLDLRKPEQNEAVREALVEAELVDRATTHEAIAALPEETTLTMWHAVNGVTASARDVESTESRLRIEAEAGRLLAA